MAINKSIAILIGLLCISNYSRSANPDVTFCPLTWRNESIHSQMIAMNPTMRAKCLTYYYNSTVKSQCKDTEIPYYECLNLFCKLTFPDGSLLSWKRYKENVLGLYNNPTERLLMGTAVVEIEKTALVEREMVKYNVYVWQEGKIIEEAIFCDPKKLVTEVLTEHQIGCLNCSVVLNLEQFKLPLCTHYIVNENKCYLDSCGHNPTFDVVCEHETAKVCERTQEDTKQCLYNAEVGFCRKSHYVYDESKKRSLDCDFDDLTESCPCECSDRWDEWSSWTTSCGFGRRERTSPYNAYKIKIECNDKNRDKCCIEVEGRQLPICDVFIQGTNYTIIEHGCDKIGGIQTVLNGKYKCKCLYGFTGSLCDKEPTDCKGIACKPNGKCEEVTGDKKIKCICNEHYTGSYCNIRIETKKTDIEKPKMSINMLIAICICSAACAISLICGFMAYRKKPSDKYLAEGSFMESTFSMIESTLRTKKHSKSPKKSEKQKSTAK